MLWWFDVVGSDVFGGRMQPTPLARLGVAWFACCSVCFVDVCGVMGLGLFLVCTCGIDWVMGFRNLPSCYELRVLWICEKNAQMH